VACPGRHPIRIKDTIRTPRNQPPPSNALNPLKRLASQTAVYGVSSVFGRFLNYLLVPVLTYTFAPAEYGVVAEFYAYMGFLAVLLMFGLETGYFRFRAGGDWRLRRSMRPCCVSAAGERAVSAGGGLLLRQPIADLLRHPEHPEYIWWIAAILALDSVGAHSPLRGCAPRIGPGVSRPSSCWKSARMSV
jgi:hypothetical protein